MSRLAVRRSRSDRRVPCRDDASWPPARRGGSHGRCYLNVATALAEVGASFDDVAKLTVYVVDWTADKMPLLMEGISRAATKLGAHPAPPFTGLGISALAGPDLLVEVEAVAVID